MTSAELRLLFPSAQKSIHLNHAGTSPIATPVAEAVQAVLAELQSENPLTAYMNAMKHADMLRDVWGRMLRTSPDNLAVVKNTSHGLTIIAQGIPFRTGENVVVAANEYPSNVYPWLAQETRGVQTRLVAPRAEGDVAEDDLESACDENTRVLAVSWVQWGTGQRMDLARLGVFCGARNILLVVDAVQGFGALRLDLSRLPGLAFATGGGHKWLLSPGGVGFLYVRPDLLETMLPNNVGWNWVAKPMAWEASEWGTPKATTARFEEGTPNVLGLAGMVASMNLLESVGTDAVESRVLELASHTRRRLIERDMHVVSPHGTEARSGIVAFRHPTVANDAVEAKLAESKVICAVRCGNVRFAPHVYSTESDIDTAVAAIP
ncbi:MAG: aminotransferase class V-fold PLP-dependent enzyme [Akkermansiaceae bacterium]|nr:aminotransferase class V-fold PLP-dependent enzyme [Armatimonadota bacterium]